MTLEAGAQLGPYEIVGPLGAGGMGEVYRAKDTRLDREVAIKVLPEHLANDADALARFEREARAVAALSHPNILAIYDVGVEEGVSYAVTELLEGETLRDRLRRDGLSWRKAVETAAAIADGLAAAHAKGIVHRDLKPGNIFLTSDGVVKILDFGLARTVGRTSREDHAETLTLTAATKPGAVMGTPAYMSPEQTRGEPADARSDIFSYGCVLYEMVVGQCAFPGDTPAELSAAILKDEPRDIGETGKTVPPELERIVRHCLEKRPEERFQSARDLAFNLRAIESVRPSRSRVLPWVGVAGVLTLVTTVLLFVLDPGGWRKQLLGEATGERIESLAILPFVNESGDPDAEFLADGIAENLINNLLTMPELRVIPRNTAFRHKGREHELDQVASELNVRAILTGRMHRQGDRLIVRAMLEDVRRDTQLWGERYEKDLSDILTIERDITREISDALRLRLSSRDLARRDKRYTDDPQAHMAYVEGRFWWNKRTADGFRRALDSFDRAIAIDPEYALAYAGKAGTYSMMGYYTHRPNEVAPLAREAAETAIRLDPTLAEAYAPLGWVYALYDWDWKAAEKAFRKAIELDPRYATAHHWYANFLAALGRFDEGEREIDRARELDPGSFIINLDYATGSFFRRDFDVALRRCLYAVEMDPTFAPTHKILGGIYVSLRRHDEAIAEFRKIVESEARAPRYAGLLGWAYGLAGRRAEALEELRILTEFSAQGEYIPATAFGMIHTGLGNFDVAFEWFDKACDERDNDLPFYKFAPTVDALRCDPRFDKLLARLNFPPYPPAPVVDPWPTAMPEANRIRLAVLPFEGPSTETDTLYLKEEIPASIIHSLSNLSGLQVVPRSTAFRYQVRDQDTAAIGRDLGATAVLTGQVNAYGGALTIRTELVDVASKRQLWSERYDRKLADILTIEEDIAKRISEKLELRLTGEDKTRLTKRYTENAEAYRAYLQGRFWWNKRSREGYSKAIELFDEAIRLDPDYALAYAGKADCYCLMVLLDSLPRECIPKARQAAEQALAADGTLAEAHTSLAWIKWVYDWDWPGAERSFRRAIELNPRYATAYNWYGPFLAVMGRNDEALEQIERAHQLDPGSLIINRDLGVVYDWTGQSDRAIEQLRQTIQMDPLFAPAHAHLGRVYVAEGMYHEAIAELEIAVDLSGGITHVGILGQAYAGAGRKDEAAQELEKLTRFAQQHYVPAFQFMLIHAGLGDKDQAFAWLEKAYENREFPMAILKVSEVLDSLRDDPRFDDLLRRIGLPPDDRFKPVVAPLKSGKIMLAVLPFERMNTDPDTDYLSEEIPASIIDNLSNLSKLRVIPRSTAFRCKIGDRDIASIGRNLNATAVLTGHINTRADGLRIRAELVDVATSRRLWGERYDQKMTDILAIEHDIAESISETLKLRLTGEERTQLAKRSTENAEAHRAYLKGRFWWNRRSRESYSKAIELFDEAIRLDPDYALAYAGKADCHCLMVLLDSPPKECIPKAREAAEQALALNDRLAEAHTSLGWIKCVYDWDWPGAERSFKRAIELNPRYATAYNWYAVFLAAMGRETEAVEQMTHAHQLDPGSLIINRDLGVIYSWTGQVDRAIEQLRQTIEMDPLFAPAHAHLGRIYTDKGMYDEAIAELETAADLAGGVTHAGYLGQAYAKAGRTDDAMRQLEVLTEFSKQHEVPAFKFSLIHAGLGDKERAFELLEKAYENREFPMAILNVAEILGGLRDDPRFDDLLRCIGLKPSAQNEPDCGS